MFSDSENTRARARDRGKRGAVRERDRAALDVLAAHVGEPRDRVELGDDVRVAPLVGERGAQLRELALDGLARDVERVHAHLALGPRRPRARPDRVDRARVGLGRRARAARAEPEREARAARFLERRAELVRERRRDDLRVEADAPRARLRHRRVRPREPVLELRHARLRAPHQRPLGPELLLRLRPRARAYARAR